ncbi:MAG: hypothetical protein NTV94_18280 [Planctomycetota bacterium]|nr:hypothetical protein [Planctomycetota bacterium]
MRIALITCALVSSSVYAQIAAFNAQEVRPFFELARIGRVDVVCIGDSNQLQRANGWDQGWHKAIANRFGEYATGLVSWGEGNGLSASQGYFYNAMPASDSQFLLGGAPPEAQAYLNNPPSLLGPHNYVYVPEGQTASGTGLVGMVVDQRCPIGLSGQLRMHFSYGLFSGSGAGSFQPYCRFEAFPFDTIRTSPVLTTRTGDESPFRLAYGSLDLPAQSRTRQISLRAVPTTSSVVGPFIAYFMRLENVQTQHGGAVSALYAVGSKSSYDMAAAVMASSDATLTNYFESIRRLQGPTKAVMVRINTGLNDRAESRPSLSSAITPGNSAAAYRDNILTMMNRIEAIWQLNGWPLDSLYFLLTPSHPVADPDEVSLRGYRDMCVQIASSRPRTACVRLDALTNATEMTSLRWYQQNGFDRNHLVEEAYDFLAERELMALIRTDCISDFNADGGVDGSDLGAFFEAWEAGDFLADVNQDGGVDGADAQWFVARWVESAC